MKHFLFSLCVLAFAQVYGQLQLVDRTDHEKFEQNAVYVMFKPGHGTLSPQIGSENATELAFSQELVHLLDVQTIVSLEREFLLLAKRNEKFTRIYRVNTAAGANLDELISELEALDCIEFAEKIPQYEISYTPNDPEYTNLSKRWHLDRIAAEGAWDITQGCAGVKIAIVDDAVRINHEDLQANIYINPGEIPGNGIDDDANGYVDDVNGYDVADGDNNPSPPANATSNYFSHGTHVAGIAAGVSDNGVGIASIGFNTSIIPVKTKSNFSTNPGALTNPMDGVEYAIAAGADIISMSWGSYGYSNVHNMIFQQAATLDIVCIAAVGNDGLPYIAYPAGYNDVISVVATDANDDIATFSNYSQEVHIWAPGVNIWSSEATTANSYGFKTGTSMATPLVSGLVGLMLCNDPQMTPYEIKHCLLNSADVTPSTNVPGLLVPRINAEQTLLCVIPVANYCGPTNCELISNGSFEIPVYSTLTSYDQSGGIAANQVCGWDDYTSADLFPLNVNAPNHFAHMQCNIQSSFAVNEAVVMQYPLNLTPGRTYRLEFDYSVVKDQDYSPLTDHLDSIAIKLLSNNWSQPNGTYTITDPTYLLGAIENPPVDYVRVGWVNWLNNADVPTQYFNHYILTFVAPNTPTMQKLVIHPVSDYPTLGFSGTLGLAVDNITLKPVTDIVASSSNYTPQANDCVTLTATTTGSDVYWEPAYLFADPTALVQNICLDTMETCAGGTLEFSVTAMDPLIGCASSDTVVLYIQGTDLIAPTPYTSPLASVASCTPISALEAPIAWDNCDGTIQGVTTTTFPLTQSTLVTWTYTDGNGNTLVQTQQVNIGDLDPTVSNMGDTLWADQIGVSYQWMNCSTGQIIPGATNQTYIPGDAGNYAVIISEGNCIDTSACFSFAGISDHSTNETVLVYPNPSSGMVSISAGSLLHSIEVMDMNGKRVAYFDAFQSLETVLELGALESGLYMLDIQTELSHVRQLLVKE